MGSQLTSFIGREREISEVKQTLTTCRLVTLIGTGGVGKTRLAMEVGGALVERYPDGVWQVELASLADSDMVPEVVARGLGLHAVPGQSVLDSLVAQLDQRRLLLILDNCEHVVGACAELADRLLRTSPPLRMLATSRRPLGVTGETLFRVPSLRVPDLTLLGTAELARFEAVQLFVERARLVRPGFALEDQSAAALADVCRRLDGIPLAIELAAARVNVLSVEQLAGRLEDRFRLLVGTQRTGSARQRTLRATLDWSYELLSRTEQRFFNRLSVFAGGWTLEAAESICSGEEIASEDVLDLLAGLVEQSLVVADEESVGERRYGMLETLRQYAREKLEQDGEDHIVRERHSDWYVGFGQRAEHELQGPQQAYWFERLAADHDNLRAALARCLDENVQSGLSLAVSLSWFWLLRGHVPEGRGWLEALLGKVGQTNSLAAAANRGAALNASGYLAVWLGDHETARARLDEGLALFRDIGDPNGEVEAICSLAIAAHRRGDDPGDLLEECLAGWRRGGGKPLPGYMTLSDLAELLRGRGDRDRAVALHQDSLELARQRGDSHSVAYALRCLGHLAWQAGEHGRARELQRQSLTMAWLLTDRLCAARCLEELALVASSEGLAEHAVRLFATASAWRRAMGVGLLPIDQADHDSAVQVARGRLSKASFEAAWSEGSALTPQQAIELAQRDGEPATAAARAPAQAEALTPREHEVVILVARGRTNRQIADELVVSERTVDAHLDHIRTKLRLHSRAQIALWAVQHGSVQPPS